MVTAEDIVMEFDLNRGKVRTLKERLFAKVEDNVKERKLFRALDGVSLQVHRGEIFGIMGSNGAGKSTLLKVLSGIMKPTSGVVRVNGRIAPMIELGTGFDFELSALENIYLGGAVLGYTKKFIESKIPEIFDFSELWDFKNIPVKYFSSGMVARLAFSVSTIVIPDVLIVDEILSVGDLAFQKKSYARMKELMTGGTTVIYVSHDVKTLAKMCTRVLWLEKGKVKMIGPAQEVCEAYMQTI
ncbi:ABC transporter ATP-binding protein [Caproiciproducens galactitolivorans]|uniref:ABC transporter ATP-binding protein n=1 Tax=Caproiciproducens galactitolivorans TaxID=642589 RepID=UPI002409CE8F|nr:ABC transporter ATP-binding protein [Caproiciproducens galactitolivorans]